MALADWGWVMRKRNLAFALLVIVAAVVAVSGSAGAGSPKQYTVAATAEPDGADLDITITITNLGPSVLGSANITVPSSLTVDSDTLSTDAPVGKTWTASLSGNVIKLRTTDGGKLKPGEAVSVSFTATPTASGPFAFGTAAKASRDFNGSSNLTLAGSNPVIVVCPETGECTASIGDVNDASPNHQAGKLTVNDCGGCVISIWETLGDFCAQPPASPSSPCSTRFVPAFTFNSGFDGSAEFILTCDVTDCDDLEAFYDVFIDENAGPTTSGDPVTKLTEDDFCFESESFTESLSGACIEDQSRLEDNDDLQSTLQLEFSNSVDPKIAH